MDGDRERNAHPQFQIGAGGDKGGNPFREVMQADAERQQHGGAFQVMGLDGLLHQVLRVLVWQHAIQRKVT
ncbi:hypothetical protein D3C75_1256180 [compost metagenome]